MSVRVVYTACIESNTYLLIHQKIHQKGDRSVDINSFILVNKDKFKKCKEKQRKLYISIPREGYTVFSEFDKRSVQTNNVLRVLVSGIRGEYYTTSVEELQSNYVHIDGTPVTMSSLHWKKIDGGAVVDWTPVIRKPSRACHWFLQVPVNLGTGALTVNNFKTQVNRTGVPHGRGDYIVCSGNTEPNLATARCVNGIAFLDQYNNRGVGDSSSNYKNYFNIEKPASNVSLSHSDMCRKVMLVNYKSIQDKYTALLNDIANVLGARIVSEVGNGFNTNNLLTHEVRFENNSGTCKQAKIVFTYAGDSNTGRVVAKGAFLYTGGADDSRNNLSKVPLGDTKDWVKHLELLRSVK